MGQFTADQLTVLKSGLARVKQTWTLYYPATPGGDVDNPIVLHNGEDIIRITDAGSREAEAYNQTLQVPGDFRVNNYKFTMSNGDNYLSQGRVDSVWDQAWMLDPTECNMEHQIYLEVGGSWEELTFLSFLGAVENIAYKSRNGLNYSATFACNNRAMMNLLNRIWDQEDGTETDLTTTFTAE